MKCFWFLAIISISCITLEMKQCGKVADEVAAVILRDGTPAGSPHAQMLKAGTAGARAALGDPATDAPVDTVNPAESDVAVMKLISKKAVKQAEARNYLKLALLGILGLSGAGAMWKGKGILSFLFQPKKLDAFAKVLVRMVNRIQGVVPEEFKPKVSRIAREVAREGDVKKEVDVAYEEERKNGTT